MLLIPIVKPFRDFRSIIRSRKFRRIFVDKKRPRQSVPFDGNLGTPLRKDGNDTMGAGSREGGGLKNKFQRHIRPIEIIQLEEG